jgi:hypothetical protein
MRTFSKTENGKTENYQVVFNGASISINLCGLHEEDGVTCSKHEQSGLTFQRRAVNLENGSSIHYGSEKVDFTRLSESLRTPPPEVKAWLEAVFEDLGTDNYTNPPVAEQ